MKANEFVKKFGIEHAELLIENMEDVQIGDNHRDYINNLKRLVESHELVQEWKLPEDDENGLDGATLYLECYAFYSTDEEKAKLDRLAQAIADVESCQ